MSPAKNIQINFDEDNDTLYVMHCDANPSRTENLDYDARVLVRVDFDSRKVVGLIINGFSKVFPTWTDLDEYILMERFEGIIESLNNPHLARAKV